MSELWCVNIIGPDDLYPAASLEDAIRAAHAFNGWGLEKFPPEDKDYVLMWANVTQWPHDPEGHATVLASNGGSACAQLSPRPPANELAKEPSDG